MHLLFEIGEVIQILSFSSVQFSVFSSSQMKSQWNAAAWKDVSLSLCVVQNTSTCLSAMSVPTSSHISSEKRSRLSVKSRQYHSDDTYTVVDLCDFNERRYAHPTPARLVWS